MIKIERTNIEAFKKDMHVHGKPDKEPDKKPSKMLKHVRNRKMAQDAVLKIESETGNTWYNEIKRRNPGNGPMAFYRGNTICAEEVFDKADRLAAALMSSGMNRGDKVIAFMSNVPEVLYLMLAASKCGMAVDFVGTNFEKIFITNILDENKKNIVFATDDNYGVIEDIMIETGRSNIVLISLADSLPGGTNPFAQYDAPFYDFKNRVNDFKANNQNILSFSELRLSQFPGL